MKPLAILLCLATPAYAQTVTAWGTFTARIVPAEDHFADVLIHNRLTGMLNTERATLFLEGRAVGIVVQSKPGDHPDTITVIPPVGFRAIPQSITLWENQRGTIAIVEVPVG